MNRAPARPLLLILSVLSSLSGCRKTPPEPSPLARADASSSTSVAPVPSASATTTTTAVPSFPADSGSGWQGEVSLSILRPPAREIVVSLAIKGNRVRYPAPNRLGTREFTSVVDVELRKMLVLPKDTQVYALLDLPKLDVDAGVSLVDTGKKQKLFGTECEVWEHSAGKAKMTACIAEDIAFVDPSMLANVPVPLWLRVMTLSKRFPIIVTETDATGALVFSVRATRIAAHPMPDADFAVPLGSRESKDRIPGSPFKPGLPI